jgi:uncharacterized protein
LFELGLLLVALLWSLLSHRPQLSDFQWSIECAVVGILAALPLLVFFVWTLKSKLPIFSRHGDLLEFMLRPMFERWSILQLLTISVIAGVSEEAFFRGAIQGSLVERVNVVLALILASAFFGVCHMITWTYAIMATVMGAYLGWLWIRTGNLLTPMVTHAVYDFAALVYFLRVYRVR